MGRARRRRWRSTTSCPGCAGRGRPARRNRRCWSTSPAARFYFFFIQLWPQEVYFITGLLVMAALALFLVTALFGRLWCGYTCPQTVWTDLYIAVERLFEGDRNARMRLDAAPWSLRQGSGARAASTLTWLADRRRRPAAPGSSTSRTRRRSGGSSGPGRRRSPPMSRSPPDLHHLRAGRDHARAGLHLSLPLAAHPGRDAGRALAAGHLPPRPRRAARPAQEGRELGRRAATASTATPASWSARPASTSATAASSNASTAAFASTPATRSWTGSAGRAA